MPKSTLIFDKSVLEDLYLVQQKNPYEIADIFKCNHKTIRKNLKVFNIPLRTRSEYNALAHKTYTEPSDALLFTKESLILHSIYKCEGCNSKSVSALCFQNQDPNLIVIFCEGIKNIYKYETDILISFIYNFNCEKSNSIVNKYSTLLSNYNTTSIHALNNKNPIIRVRAGGSYLFNLFMENTEKIFNKELL